MLRDLKALRNWNIAQRSCAPTFGLLEVFAELVGVIGDLNVNIG